LKSTQNGLLQHLCLFSNLNESLRFLKFYLFIFAHFNCFVLVEATKQIFDHCLIIVVCSCVFMFLLNVFAFLHFCCFFFIIFIIKIEIEKKTHFLGMQFSNTISSTYFPFCFSSRCVMYCIFFALYIIRLCQFISLHLSNKKKEQATLLLF
jgi:hypothetical protein